MAFLESLACLLIFAYWMSLPGLSRFTIDTMGSELSNEMLSNNSQFDCCTSWWLCRSWKTNYYCIGNNPCLIFLFDC